MGYTRAGVRWIARAGYGARGLVYLAVGGLALHAALEFEQARDVRGAMREISNHAGGQIVLFALALGLAAYSFWRLVQTTLDVDGHGWRPGGLAVRLGLLVSAGLHASLALACVEIALRLSSNGGKPVQQAVSRTLEWPAGPVLVVIGGLVVAGAGIAHIHKGVSGGFRRWFEGPQWLLRLIDPVCRVGLTARGLLFLGVAAFVIHAALTLDPAQARGVEGVMLWVQERIYGRLLLGLLALGVLAFGAYSCIEAFVRRVGLGRAV